METSWYFFAVRAATPSGFRWQWQKQGAGVPVTSAPFDYYFDCISDARGKGYAGPLPPGPKVPLPHLPIVPIEKDGVTASLRPKDRSEQGVITLTAVSAVDARRRRTGGRSPVS